MSMVSTQSRDPDAIGEPGRSNESPVLGASANEWRPTQCALPPSVEREVKSGIESCSDVLMNVAAWLHLSPFIYAPPMNFEQAQTAAHRVEASVLACADDLRSLVALLEQDLSVRDGLERDLCDATSALRQSRRDLRHSQVYAANAEHTAMHDALTGLPNRVSFDARLRAILAERGTPMRPFGLMYIDLDGFKAINDSYGHALGDDLLRIVGSRLTHAVRDDDSISRHGGDEFLCLLHDIQSEAQVAMIAKKLFDAIASPCHLGNFVLRVRPSIGIALFPQNGNTADALLSNADTAMYWAKQHRHEFAFFGNMPVVDAPVTQLRGLAPPVGD